MNLLLMDFLVRAALVNGIDLDASTPEFSMKDINPEDLIKLIQLRFIDEEEGCKLTDVCGIYAHKLNQRLYYRYDYWDFNKFSRWSFQLSDKNLKIIGYRKGFKPFLIIDDNY